MTFIKAKSVDSILGAFTKAIKDLEQLAQDKAIEAVENEEKAAKYLNDANKANTEANRAIQASIKIKSITE